MSSKTSNYSLHKIDLTDAPPDITVLNENWDTIDGLLGGFAPKDWITPVTTSGTDLNNYKTQGIYSFGQSYSPSNIPTGNSNGWLIVIPWNNNPAITTIKQIWLRHGIVNTNDYQIWVRTMIGGTWSSWYNLTDRVAKGGDTMTGALSFNNKDEYGAINKTRTVSNKDYTVDFGCGVIGGNGCAAVQCKNSSGTVIGRIEVSASGVSFMNEQGKRTYLYTNELVSATTE